MPGQIHCPSWIILHGVNQEPYCDLCKKVAVDEHRDPDKHVRQVYWFDEQTKDSIGGGGGTLAVQQQPQLASDPGLLPGWWEATDRNTGRPYHYRADGEVTWYRPCGILPYEHSCKMCRCGC